MAQPNKGPRVALTFRLPEAHYAYFVDLAEEYGVPVADAVAYSASVSRGLRIPLQVLRAVPALIRIYPEESWPEVIDEIDEQEPEVAARIRAVLPELYPPTDEQMLLAG